MRIVVFLALLLAWLAGPVAAGEPRLRIYMFGNSLVNHPSDDPDTNVPVWLARMARQDGRQMSLDGQWGFLRNFAEGPATANWGFRGVRGAWNPDRRPFGRVAWTDIVITPANFIQHRAPGKRYEDASFWGGPSPLSATLELVDRLAEEAPGARLWLYEGWADMAPFEGDFAGYNAWNRGGYHQWYLDWRDAIRAARPGVTVELIPVARVLAELFEQGPLAGIGPGDLYTDNAPHGTATLYLLAAMVVYGELFGAPPPADYRPPEGIHPLLRDNFAGVSAAVWRALGRAQAGAAGATGARVLRAPEAEVAQAEGAGEVVPAPEPAVAPTPAPGFVAPRARLAPGLEDPALAFGLNGISDWSPQQPFIDVMKTARRWVGHEGERWGAWSFADLREGGYLDARGWPRRLPRGVRAVEALILTEQPAEARALAGRYRVRWAGSGRLRLTGAARKVSIGDHEAWFSYRPGGGPVGIAIEATDPEGTGDYIRDISVVREAHLPLFDAGALFNPDWLAVIGDARILRFMDWMQTNNSPVVSWQDRPRVDDFSYTLRGVPVEVMVRLANRIGADAWFNMPHMADDDYNRRFARYVRDHLDPRQKAWVEYSNELWNFTFGQAGWAGAQARARWGRRAGDDAWMQFAGLRAARVAAIWAGEFGPEAGARLVRVVAVHTGWPGLEEALLEAPLEPGLRPGTAFDAYAVAGYFGHDLGAEENAALLRDWARLPRREGFARAEALIRAGSLAGLTGELLPYHAGVAGRWGLELAMYEGGTHVLAEGDLGEEQEIVDFLNDFNYSEQMAGIYRTLLESWRAAGGRAFNVFVDVARPSRWGAWGALRHLQDDNPRWQALAGWNRAGAWWDEGRAPGAFAGGLLVVGGAGADLLNGGERPDVLLGLDGDDVLVAGPGDRLNGGAGFDAAILPGAPQEWEFLRGTFGEVFGGASGGADGGLLWARGADSAAGGAAGGALGAISLAGIEAVQFAGAPEVVLEAAALGR